MTTKMISKAFLFMLALAALGGCASYGERQATAGVTSPAQSSSAALDRFFEEANRNSRIGR